MKEKKKILSKYKRKIIVNNQTWTYQLSKSKMGENGYLKICNPSRTKKYTFDIPILGKSNSLDNFECCPEEYDGNYDELISVSIKPSDIIGYINKIINQND